MPNLFVNGPGYPGYSWCKATDVPEGKSMDDLFKEIYKKATEEKKKRGYIVDDLKKYDSAEYGVTKPDTL